MAAKKKALSSEGAFGSVVLEGVLRHKGCGWISDGSAFVSGAGCPKCGGRLTEANVEEVTESKLVNEKESNHAES